MTAPVFHKPTVTAHLTPEELAYIHTQVGLLMTETAKLNAEAAQLHCEYRWHPLAIVIAAFGAGATTCAVGLAALLKFI